MNEPPFEKGDKVRLARGWTMQTVVDVKRYSNRSTKSSGWAIKAQYESQARWSGTCYDGTEEWRDAIHYVPWRGDPRMMHDDTDSCGCDECKAAEANENQLFQVKGQDLFGVKIATNSAGQYVLEMKGQGGVVKAYHAHELEEVMPYTVDLRRLGSDAGLKSSERENRTMSIQVRKDSMQKDQVVLSLQTGSIWRVVAVDTKRRRARPATHNFMLLEGKLLIVKE